MTTDSVIFRALELYGTQLPHRGQWWLHARLRQLLGADLDAELDAVREGLLWQLNPADLVHQNLFWLGTDDHWDLHHIQRTLTSGSVLLDVGANFGHFSLTLAHYLSRQCRVHALEPNPPTYERLVKNITRNQLGTVITPHLLGLSDHPGTAYLQPEPNPAGGLNSGAATLGNQIHGVPIPLQSLDHFCAEQRLARLDFLKIDVEGFEERVLRGAPTTLATFQPLICIELNPSTLTRQGASVKRVADMLVESGYKLFYSQRERLLPLTSLPAGDSYLNALAFPSSRLPQ